MSQQNPFGSANERYRKKLFVDNGLGFVEVRARVVNPYEPPLPKMNVREIKIINAPSHLHQMGLSAYKAKLTLLFETKQDYSDYLAQCGWTHKFYDEKGHIFVGALESINAEPVVKLNGLDNSLDRNKGYKAEAEFTFVKKDGYDRKHRFAFQDIEGHWAQENIEEMSDLGLVSVITKDGYPVVYFRPNTRITRAEFVVFLNRTRRLMERSIRE
ncbi:S-layer homology domain-containing protein [Paenibacillus sp. NPDC058071]|uniref:S-layer homology domain-containing protein n=1 Tax=Paenibacillus sp. NPDC058071 TaxID=3346326 RepID=UPI0036D98E2A